MSFVLFRRNFKSLEIRHTDQCSVISLLKLLTYVWKFFLQSNFNFKFKSSNLNLNVLINKKFWTTTSLIRVIFWRWGRVQLTVHSFYQLQMLSQYDLELILLSTEFSTSFCTSLQDHVITSEMLFLFFNKCQQRL